MNIHECHGLNPQRFDNMGFLMIFGSPYPFQQRTFEPTLPLWISKSLPEIINQHFCIGPANPEFEEKWAALSAIIIFIV